MEAALLYLLKANVVLALFAAAYYGLLRRLTFFQLNRAFLLLALLFAAVYPALPMPGLLPAEAPAGLPATWVLTESPATSSAAGALPVERSFDWAALALVVYAAGAGLLLARLLVQLLGAWRGCAAPSAQLLRPLACLTGSCRRPATRFRLGAPFTCTRRSTQRPSWRWWWPMSRPTCARATPSMCCWRTSARRFFG
jgi:hypothetical protein